MTTQVNQREIESQAITFSRLYHGEYIPCVNQRELAETIENHGIKIGVDKFGCICLSKKESGSRILRVFGDKCTVTKFGKLFLVGFPLQRKMEAGI